MSKSSSDLSDHEFLEDEVNDSEQENIEQDQRHISVKRQIILFDDNWTQKSPQKSSRISQAMDQGEATLLEVEQGEGLLLDIDQDQVFTLDDVEPIDPMIPIDDDNEIPNIIVFSPDHSHKDSERVRSVSRDSIPTSSLSVQRRALNLTPSPTRSPSMPKDDMADEEIEQPPAKFRTLSMSSSRSRSYSPAQKKQKRKLGSASSNSAFQFVVNSDEEQRTPQHADSHRIPSSANVKHSSQNISRQFETSEDEDDSDTENLNEIDLRLKLKEQKRERRRTGELLNKLHDNYEDLLAKYAHAENTIDQLRFRSRSANENTPSSSLSEHQIRYHEQPTASIPTLKSSEVHKSTNVSPFSSIRPVTSTTSETPVRKSNAASSLIKHTS